MAPKNIPTQAVLRIAKIERQLSSLPDPILTSAELANLEIHKGALLDIDDASPSCPQPAFFRPLSDGADLRGAVIKHETELSRWPGYCTRKHHAIHCADQLGRWFASLSHYEVPDLMPAGDPRWQGRRYDRSKAAHRFPRYTGQHQHPKTYGLSPPDQIPTWMNTYVYFVEGQPHLGCMVLDSTIPEEGEVLRSELTTAVHFMRCFLQSALYPGQTIPVVIYMIAHSKARITQVHYDAAEGVVFRQSRLLDLVSESYQNPDVYLFLRWLNCVPIGDTELREGSGESAAKPRVLGLESQKAIQAGCCCLGGEVLEKDDVKGARY